MRTNALIGACVAVAALSIAPAAMAGSHLWRFNEVYSNADGTIQFIEMRECCGAANETNMGDKWVASDGTGLQFDFPANLDCNNCTANAYLLLATEGFAALPGAPTPDYIIPENFVSLDGDFLRFWMYAAAIMSWEAGDLPADGTNSLQIDGTTAVNTPTNFAGETGTVSVPCSPADIDGDGEVAVSDLLELLAGWGPCGPECPADIDGDLMVGVGDLLIVLAEWGPCD